MLSRLLFAGTALSFSLKADSKSDLEIPVKEKVI